MAGSNAASDSTKNFPREAIPADFGAILREGREARGWTKAHLAREAKLRRETVVHLEAGRRKPTPDTVFRLEAALELLPRTLVPDWPEWSPIGLSTLGARSRERRREMRLSLDQVAKSPGVDVGASTLSRFEREVGAPHHRLAKYLVHEGIIDVVGLVNDDYARVLGFTDAEAHENWCRGPE